MSGLTPVDGVIFTGENVDTVGRWLERHDRAWSFNPATRSLHIESWGGGSAKPMSLIEFDDGALSVRPVEPIEDVEPGPPAKAPVHFLTGREARGPIGQASTLCGLPLLDALTGDPILAVSRGHRDRVDCDECRDRLLRAEYGRHPNDLLLERLLEEVAGLRAELRALIDRSER